MDLYSKIVLTIIAVMLSAIAVKEFSEPRPITMADIRNLQKIKNDEERNLARIQLLANIPLVRVHSGAVSIDGPVTVEGDVSINGPVEIER